MAKKVYDELIDKNIPWDGNELTGNLPVKGTRIEEFIKNTFNSKMGYFYYDPTANRYLVFADEQSKNEYIENPTLTNLVLSSFDAPFNYEASINMITPSYNAIFLGSTGNYLDFSFDIKNKEGNSTGENVTVTYTFIRNANKKVITETRRYGELVHFNIDEHLLEGTNTIIVGISGQNTFAATTSAVTYQVVNLMYSDEFNISKIYDLSKGSKILEIFYNISGYGTKVVEWFLDGEQLEFIKSEDEIVNVSSQRTKYIEISNLNTGIHTLQSRAYTLINGEKFYTNILYREFIVNNGNVLDTFITVAVNIPNSHGIVTNENPLIYYGAEQYLSYNIRFATSKTSNVSIKLNNEILTTLVSNTGIETNYSIISNKEGTLDLSFVINNIERTIPFIVNKTSLNIEEITTGLVFDFNTKGKSNTSINRDEWNYNSYVGKLIGFKWNNLSGWINNSLIVDTGSEFNIDYSPLLNDVTLTGGTFEFEFSTNNVENDNAVICDLTTNGVGILITASEASITSAAGVSLSTKYKAGENHRISFVINRKSGVAYKGLAFIYVDGIISGAVNYGNADNFISNKTISFKGTTDAQIALKAMRFYNRVLSSNDMINNFILYRNTLVEMFEAYYRNQIYEEGSEKFSPENLAHYIPVMIITGDIPVLESATDTSVQIIVDIEFINEQDPTKSFVMKNVVLKIQGTSSLTFPRKNFRIYTRKEESSVVYDYLGNVILDKLFAFKDGAQPVDCWNLKADYAESSGTHNTGIARLWNKVMYGAIIQHTNVLGETINGYTLRTQAQIAALSEGYPYDVRTTVDGFPIVLFYRQNVNDDLIFLGKYNFNNDKSTPSVFGFEGIPGFDNSRMQCWETRDNGNPLGLFTDISQFDEKWSGAFESRYPDTKTPNTADLKTFSLWINSVSQNNFIREKWEHFDVYKVAAYYVYLMRFGAVDQPVKNAFITSEDGEHFYFINYDNDTINGLINTGRLALDPTVNRNTIGSDGEYVYAGHDSVLWNKLTDDAEFMEIVKVVDNALYSAGLRYEEVIKIFNDEQAYKWAEAIYNQDAEYKYLLPYVNQATNNLFMLQGSRSSHRSWWLSKRFSLYDSIFISGAYRERNIAFRCLNDTPKGQKFTITAATKMGYGYGLNNDTRDVGIELEIGDSHTFTTTNKLFLGDVVKVFAAANLESLDLSEMTDRLTVLDCSAAADPALGTKTKRLIVGGKGKVNTELTSISGINVLSRLQVLNIKGCQGIISLDLTKQNEFRKLYATGSGVASVDFAAGAPVDYVELPSAMMSLNFNQLPYLTLENIVLEDGFSNINQVVISGCPNLSKDFNWVYTWYKNKTISDDNAVLEMDGIDWTGVDYRQLIELSNVGTLKLKGKVFISEGSQEIVNAIKEAFGDEVFNKKSDFYVQAPDGVYISGASKVLEGESTRYICAVFSEEEGRVQFSLTTTRQGCSIDPTTGVLTTTENGLATSNIVVRAVFISNSGNSISSTMTVTVEKRTYPTSAEITGDALINSSSATFNLTITPTEVTGAYSVVWTLDDNASEFLEIDSYSDTHCKIRRIKEGMLETTLTAELIKKVNGSSIISATKNISLVIDGVVITKASNPALQECLYKNGLVANENYSMKWELALITANQIQPGTTASTSIFNPYRTSLTNMDVFEYFTGVTEIKTRTFQACNKIESIKIPNSVVTIGDMAFEQCSELKTIIIPNSVTTIGSSVFSFCRALEKIILLEGAQLKTVGNGTFYSCTNIKEIHIGSISDWCRISYYNNQTVPFYYSEGGNLYLNNVPLTEVEFTEDITEWGNYCFSHIKSIQKFIVKCPINASYVFTDCSGTLILETSSLGTSALKNNKFGEVILGENFNSLNISCFQGNLTSLTKLSVSEKNTKYDSRDECNAVIETATNTLMLGCNISTIPDGVVTIGDNAFYGCSSLASFTIPNSVTSIGYRTFFNCSSLQSIDLSVNIKSMGEGAFYGCIGLLEIDLSNLLELTSINKDTFYNCKKLTSVKLPKSLVSIGLSAFKECSNLTSISIPNGVNNISDGAFNGCSSLTTFVIPASVTAISNSLFYGCSSLSAIDIHESVSSIDYGAFQRCVSLKQITSRRASAPSVSSGTFGTGTNDYTGRNTYNTGENILYVPQGATGYESSYWLSVLLDATKCGFTISYTL